MKNTRPKNWNPNNTHNPVKICERCGKEYIRRHNRQIYCPDCKKPEFDPSKGSVPRVCKNCNSEYLASSMAQKYCWECAPIMKKARDKARKESNKKGYNQKGENNNNWKGGIGVYRGLADEYGLPKECERCGSTKNLLVHHKDRDRYNNNPDNLERLCKSCHQKEHDAGINLHPDTPVFRSNKV